MKKSFNFNKHPLILVGFMGSGKSTTGKILSDILSAAFIDMDEEIEKEYEMTVPEIFENRGEKIFREMESDLLEKIADRKLTVISSGGGIIKTETNRNLIKKDALVVWLNCPFEKCVERCSSGSRPLLDKENDLKNARKIFSERENLYLSVADVVIDSGNLSPFEAAEAIARILKS